MGKLGTADHRLSSSGARCACRAPPEHGLGLGHSQHYGHQHPEAYHAQPPEEAPRALLDGQHWPGDAQQQWYPEHEQPGGFWACRSGALARCTAPWAATGQPEGSAPPDTTPGQRLATSPACMKATGKPAGHEGVPRSQGPQWLSSTAQAHQGVHVSKAGQPVRALAGIWDEVASKPEEQTAAPTADMV